MNLFKILKPKGDIAYLIDDSSVVDAMNIMRMNGYTALPVINKKGEYVGSVSEGDFLWEIVARRGLHKLEDLKVKDIIRPNWMPAAPIYITKTEVLERALNQNYIPMVDGRNIFMGIITRHDIISWLMPTPEKQV